MGGAPAAWAADWKITPIIDVTEAYNSNINLSRSGNERSDFITDIRPGVSVRGTGRHLALGADYSPDFLIFADNSSQNEIRHIFNGFAHSEILPQRFFLSAAGAATHHEIGQSEPVNQSPLTASENFRQVTAFDVSPSLNHHFGPFADAELRYRFGSVTVDASQVANTLSNEVSGLLRSGRQFEVLSWRLLARQNWTERQGGQSAFGNVDTTTTSARGDLQYAITPTFALLAGGGYDKIEDSSLRAEIDGPFGEGGFLYRPHERLSLRATYGHRFERSNAGAEVIYRITGGVTLNASFSQSVRTSQNILAGRLERLGMDEVGRLVDTQSQLPFEVRDPASGLVSGAFRQDLASASLTIERGRNLFRLTGHRDERELNVASGNVVSTVGSASWSRNIGRFVDGDLSISYRHATFDTPVSRSEDSVTVRAGLGYRFSETLVASLSAEHSQVDRSAGRFDVEQQVVAVRLVKRF